MMSSDNNITLESETQNVDTKMDNKFSKEEECEYYKQRFNCLKIVQERIANELTQYKNRCLGVDTIQSLLKESRQENAKLSKHVKSLETDMSLLQKRLEKNGLSKSINTQDSELFAPSASKQTLDNLAKETVRLRSLLKQDNELFIKKSADEIEEMKFALEEADSEINELKNKIKDMEDVKLKLISGYEQTIEKLTKEMQEEKENFQKHLKAKEANLAKEDEQRKNESLSASSSAVQELKNLLIKTVEKCSALNEQLLIGGVASHTTDRDAGGSYEREMHNSVSKEEYERLELRHQEAVNMNQKWQVYTKEREKQFHDKVQELSDPHRLNALIEDATMQKTMELHQKDAEIIELRNQIAGLSKELTDARNYQKRIQQDSSTVEILKQQIQVCTEDFNTERKDRELAVQKARALKEDAIQLNTENAGLKRQIELLKKTIEQQPKQMNKPPSYESSLSSPGYNSASSAPPQYNSSYVQAMGSRYPHHAVQESTSHDQSVALPFSTVQSPVSMHTVQSWSPASHSDLKNYASIPRQGVPIVSGSPNYPSMPRIPLSVVPGTSTPTSAVSSTNYDARNHASMSQSPVASFSGALTPPLSNVSMQPLMRRSGAVKEELTCPKCSQRFSDDVLVSHIEACTQ